MAYNWADGNGGAGALDHGFFDYNDTATATTPVTVTGGGTAYLTNDEAGSFTSKTYAPTGVSDVWIAGATNEFDWSALALGDTIDIRLDVELDIQSVNTEVAIALELGSGSYTIAWLNPTNYKNTGAQSLTIFNSIYIGDTGTHTGGGKFIVAADKTCDVKVNGWYVRIFK